MSTRAQRMGIRTGHASPTTGTVLDTWFPSPALGERRAGEPVRAPADLESLVGQGRPRRGIRARGRARRHRPRRAAGRRRRRLPAPAPALAPPRAAQHHQPRRHLRGAPQRRVDQRTARAPSRASSDPAAPARAAAPVAGLRRRQVPADDRLRRARPACASPTPTGCGSAPTSPPGTTVMHEGFCNFNAGTLGTSMVEGRIVPGRRRRRRLRHRRRRLDHGHPLRRRHGARRASASAACSAPTPASASRSATTASSRPGSTSPPAPRSPCRTAGSSRPASCPGRRATAVPPQLGDRRGRGALRAPARASCSTPRCTPTTDHAARACRCAPTGRRPHAAPLARPSPSSPSSLRRRVARRRLPRRSRAWSRNFGRAVLPGHRAGPQRDLQPRSRRPTPPRSAASPCSRGLPPRAATIAIATAIQESKLRNLNYGDRDSLGLFQQRPSQGWGTAEQILDPVHATNVLRRPGKVKGYETRRSPRSPRRSSAAPSPRPTPTTSRRAGCSPRP